MMKYLNKAMRGLISCVGNPYPLFAMATQSHLSTQPYFFKLLGRLSFQYVCGRRCAVVQSQYPRNPLQVPPYVL